MLIKALLFNEGKRKKKICQPELNRQKKKLFMVLVDGQQRYKDRTKKKHDVYKSVKKYNSQNLILDIVRN